ncbi:transcription regulator protein BACH1 [Nannospalax galili]|uniref:BTB and CNC homology 1, basic leucine zipper transcription factor 1 n=1 Tax=Nannospalax galili TaxID=1026970 RepID=A0A8C6R9Q1_NANGA|nr:transcription regulator protein BACH1 [Nannospalax galili]
MSVSESAVFAYESSVHSTNVLLSLNDQRKKDVLCDVTVLVEGQRFRAHRSVLAACSSYFHSRIVGQASADLTITLPEEVTVKGFEPLIQFAYTAKLILSKDNVDEVCKCVEFLSVHNIEESCFQFLKFKFLDSTADQEECSRKKCFSHCQKADLKFSLSDQRDTEIGEAEEFLEKNSVQTPQCKLQRCQGTVKASPPLQDSASQTCQSMCLEKDAALALPSLCPKYRKFQKAFGTDKIRTLESGIKDVYTASGQPNETSELECLGGVQGCADWQVILKCEEKSAMELENTKRKGPVSQCPAEETEGTPFPPNPADSHGLYSLSLIHTYDQSSDLSFAGMQSTTVKTEKPLSGTDAQEEKPFGESQDLYMKSDTGPKEDSSLAPSDRSSVEREVAEHLAKGFWSDICSTDSSLQMQLSPAVAKDGSEQNYSQRRSECPWLGIRISESPEPGQRTFTTLSSVNCPFISTLSSEGCSSNLEIGSDDYVSEPQQEPCPYACVISLGDDSETDTEGDSESCSAREQECEVKLPFNAQRIISLSRNDFQSLLKMHKLTPEQLDCIHDIRRRSKNRIAAQRCRKRKLDCIQNLESEIEKLQSEKESLLKERDHILSTLGETKQNLTGLCQQVCKEAALSQEQIQILAKYSASDCPLSFLISEKGKSTPDGELAFPSIFSSSDVPPAAPPPSGRGSSQAGREQGQESQAATAPVPEQATLLEPCRQSAGISDFCQQMTDKCTTDE